MPKVIKKLTQDAVRPYPRPESDLIISVNYDPETDTVESLNSFQVYNHLSGTLTSITAIMFDCFHDQAQAMIDSIDWKTEWLQQHAMNAGPFTFNRQNS